MNIVKIPWCPSLTGSVPWRATFKEAGGNDPAIYLHGGYDGIFPKVEATLKGVRMATEDEIA